MKHFRYFQFAFFAIIFLISSCNQNVKKPNSVTFSEKGITSASEELQQNTSKNLYWGDTHLHTNFSVDAYLFGTMIATPDDAYRFAKGEILTHPVTQQKVQIKTPLDFLVVADHAERLGTFYAAKRGDKAILASSEGETLRKIVNSKNPFEIYMGWMKKRNQGAVKLTEVDTGPIMKSLWKEYSGYADTHNEPGKFTAFIGWEWTSMPNGNNMHRVIFTPESSDKTSQFLPYSSSHSDKPEDLWNWLNETSERLDIDFTAIPHNSNVSGGLMFPEEKSYKGNPVNKAYAQMRSKWESVAEITQIKGTSETTPSLSPNDEFANFELWDILLTAETGKVERGNPGKGDFLRDALGTGMKIEEKSGVNPYKYGFIGSSDAHTAMPAVEEDNFQGKFFIDGLQPQKNKEVILSVKAIEFSSSGYAAVWAENNSRKAIFEAFKRKEVYATSGPRIQLRLFAGYDFEKTDIDSPNYIAIGYKKGVPMGGDLLASTGKAPKLMIHAAKDPKSANLDRIQVVKGWLENGEFKEKVFDVSWSGNRSLNAKGKLPPVGNTVDVLKATYTNTIGTRELSIVWEDPEFNAQTKAFYYARVLEIPTPRYSTYASAKLGIEPWKEATPTIQERAYSSPIWYTPN